MSFMPESEPVPTFQWTIFGQASDSAQTFLFLVYFQQLTIRFIFSLLQNWTNF